MIVAAPAEVALGNQVAELAARAAAIRVDLHALTLRLLGTEAAAGRVALVEAPFIEKKLKGALICDWFLQSVTDLEEHG